MFKRIFGMLIAFFILNSAVCFAAELIIFHTNDMHCRVQNIDDDGQSIGLAEISAAVKATKAKNAALFFDAGDTLHGMPVINISNGENLIPLLNAAGYDAMTAGNHDFNYGSAQLQKIAKQLNFPILDANIVRKGSNKRIFKPYKIFKLNGMKIGVFGLSTPDTALTTNSRNVETINFLNPVEISREMIKKLRPKCDILIAIMHMGVDASAEFTSERIARETDGIDLIIDGHSHTALPDGIKIGDTLIVQTGCYEHFLGCVKIEVENHKIISKHAKLLDSDDVKAISPIPDEKILQILAEVNENGEKLLNEVIAHSDRQLSGDRLIVRRNESELGNLYADALRWAAKTDISIVNGGSLRTGLPAGDIHKRDILALSPFGNTVCALEINGAIIRKMLEHSVEYYPASFGGFLNVSGMTFTYDSNAPAGSRVKKILIGGQNIDENKIYTIAMSDFQKAGGDGYGMLKNLKVIGQFGFTEDCLVDYINKIGIKGIETGRITRL